MRFILLVILLLNKALSGRLATGISGRERIGIGGRFMQEYAVYVALQVLLCRGMTNLNKSLKIIC